MGPIRRATQAALIAGFAVVAVATAASPALAHGHQGRHSWWWHGHDSKVLYASPNGGAGSCRFNDPCSLTTAVATAHTGATVIALPGTYDGGVQIDTSIRLRGQHATIDAGSSPFGNGVQILGPGGSGSTVEGFTIENAKFEGILVGTAPVAPATTDGTPVTTGTSVSAVTIRDNTLTDNGTGFGTGAGQCFSTPEAPGDCGETIHLVSVTNSLVEDNNVIKDVGGILLTDEFGPTSGNVVRGNRTIGNTDDCGITLAGHNPAAVNPATGDPTGAAGVFDNVVEGNISNDNGVAGQGAGILLGGGAPFAGVYDNVIRENVAIGNGLAGITIHQHSPGDLNGNVIQGNFLSNDNIDGDYDFATPDTKMTGILVASGAVPGGPTPGPITGTVIRRNVIVDVQVGIFTLNAASTDIRHNLFGAGVTTPVSTN
jgi:nitrous oxidase accessory protein NosD